MCCCKIHRDCDCDCDCDHDHFQNKNQAINVTVQSQVAKCSHNFLSFVKVTERGDRAMVTVAEQYGMRLRT